MRFFCKSIFVAVMSILTFSAIAQEETEFTPQFNLHLQGGVGYTVGEASFVDMISPAAALSLGYQFSPIFGTRLGVSGFQGRGGIPAISEVYKLNQIQGSLDFTMDICNLFSGYKYNRVVNPYIFLGAGYLNGYNNDEAIELDSNNSNVNMENLWDGNKAFFSGRAGLGADFRISNRVSLSLEVNVNALSDKFNSKKAPTLDWHSNALAGIKVKFGKSQKKSSASTAPVSTATTTPKKAEETPKAEPKPQVQQKVEKVETKVAEIKKSEYNVFFKINSATISDEGKSTIETIAKNLKSNPSTNISVVGYADKLTGNATYNSKLSEKRAEAVVSMLEANGISKARISSSSKGDTVQPFAVNEKNRVVICVVE